MAYDTIELSISDGIARLTLNRPDAANGIDLALANDLRDATFAINRDPSVRVVLLTGNGARFCGGGDVKGFGSVDDLPTHLREILAGFHTAVAQLVRGDALVVAAVQGSAAGAGIGLVGLSDYVVSAESTKYVMAYTGIGLTPDGASSWFLPRTIGLKRALELTVTNRVLSAQEALDWGLITEVVPDDELTARAEAVAVHFAGGPTAGLRRGEAAAPHESRALVRDAPPRRGRGHRERVGHRRRPGGHRRLHREAQAHLYGRVALRQGATRRGAASREGRRPWP